MIDLQQFCGVDDVRSWLEAPFSGGGRTWATNGHILVSVPERSDIPLSVDAYARVAHAWNGANRSGDYIPLPRFDEPQAAVCRRCNGTSRVKPCTTCDESGYEVVGEQIVECPTCQGLTEVSADPSEPDTMLCDACEGHPVYERVRVAIGTIDLAPRYAMMLRSLPGIEIRRRNITDPMSAGSPLPFRFDDGGKGLLMPLTRTYRASDTIIVADFVVEPA